MIQMATSAQVSRNYVIMVLSCSCCPKIFPPSRYSVPISQSDTVYQRVKSEEPQSLLGGAISTLYSKWSRKVMGIFGKPCCWAISGLASPIQHVFKRSGVAPNKAKTKLEDVSETMLNFFNPVTCRPKEDQAVVACHAGENINKTTCLKNRCCHSSKKSSELQCFTPLRDKLQLTLRMVGLGIGGMIILGCLPLFCCTCLQGSKWTNPLLKANKEVEQIMQKQTEKNENIGGFLLDLLREDAKDHKRQKREKMPADLEQHEQDKDASVT